MAQFQAMVRGGLGAARAAVADALRDSGSRSGVHGAAARNTNAATPAERSEVQIASKRTGNPSRGPAASSATPGAPRGITVSDLPIVATISRQARRVEQLVARLAEAATFVVPEPAELAVPTASAIVLKASDRSDSYGFDPDGLGRTIELAAEGRLGGHVASVDQFAFEGHRYRHYTLTVSSGLFDQMVRSLNKYRAPADAAVLRALLDQGRRMPRSENVAFFSASGSEFESAVRSFSLLDAEADGQAREVHIFVVE
jgi:hypothetical protein